MASGPANIGSDQLTSAWDLIPGVAADSNLTTPARGFLIVTDGTLVITTRAGVKRTYNSGTFATNVIHSVYFTQLNVGTTATVLVAI